MKPYSLPLTAREIRWALRRGLGRLHLHYSNFGLDDYEDDLIYSSLHCQVFDPQCEDSRCEWLLGLMDRRVQGRLLSALAQQMPRYLAREQRHDLKQQMQFCLELAKRGFKRARGLLYQHFEVGPYWTLIGSSEILELDSVEGLRWLVRRILTSESCDETCVDQILQLAESLSSLHNDQVCLEGLSLPEIQALGSEAETRLREFKERLETPPEPGQQKTAPNCGSPVTIEWVLQQIDKAQGRHYTPGLVKAAQGLSQEAIRELAEILLGSDNLHRQHHLFRVFAENREIPIDTFERHPDGWLTFLEHPDDLIRRRAHQALGKVQHPRIRDLARQKLLHPKTPGDWSCSELNLWQSNLEPADVPLLMEHLRVPSDDGLYHRTIFSLLDLLRGNSIPEVEPLALLVYQSSPCMICREDSLEVLQDLNLLPDWIAQEWPLCAHRFQEAT